VVTSAGDHPRGLRWRPGVVLEVPCVRLRRRPGRRPCPPGACRPI